jgi:hypothetical protein
MQRWVFSRLQPSVASSTWFGAIIGPVFAFVIVLLLSVAFSLTLGSTLDQGSFGGLNTGSALSSSGLSSSNPISLFSNPLMLLAYAHRSAFDLKVSLNLSVPDTTVLGTNISGSVTPPLTLLLLIPAIGLIFGGYLAASTNYAGRRLFSVTRGASICVIYALLVLIISLAASTGTTLSSESDTSAAVTLSLNAEAFSAFLNALLWGLVFGALGGYLHSRSLPKAAPARLSSRAVARIRGALAGAGIALAIHFALCLILVVGLYILAVAGGPALRSEGSPTSFSGTSSGPLSGNCGINLQQPASSSTTPAVLPNNLATHLSFAIDSPAVAIWLMPVSMGVPFAINGAGSSITIGLFASDCGPGSAGAVFYFLLLLPAAAIFVGGWFAARSAQARTTGEAAGVGLLMAAAITLFLLIATFLTSLSISVGLANLGATVTIGPSFTGVLLAGLIFGAVLGVLGSIVGQPRNLPPLQASVPSAWPGAPVGWPAAPQGTAHPVVSTAIASFPPASAQSAPLPLGDQPTIVNPTPPGAPPAADAPSESTLQSP